MASYLSDKSVATRVPLPAESRALARVARPSMCEFEDSCWSQKNQSKEHPETPDRVGVEGHARGREAKATPGSLIETGWRRRPRWQSYSCLLTPPRPKNA